MGAVQPGEGLNGLNAGQSLVDVHRVQQGLIEARLVLLGNEQHLVLLGCEVLGQLLLPHAFVHLHLGVGRTGELVVLDDPRERHQRLDRIPLLLDVAVKALFVANCFEPRAGHDHRLGTSADFVTRGRVEMLDHDFRLLCDIVWMQVHEPGKRTGGLLALHVRVVFTCLEKPVIRGVVRVVLQHVENEPLLDRLAHGIAVRGLAAAPEDLERLVFRRRRKGKKAQVGLPAALGHAEEERFRGLIFHALLCCTSPRFLPQPLASQHFLQSGGRLAALRAVGLVDHDCAAAGRQRARRFRTPLLRHIEKLMGDEGKLLQSSDDDRDRVLQRLRELPRAFVDLPHHTAPVLELVDGVLELLIEHHAVRYNDYAVEDAGVVRVVQRGETVREPCNGVALAAAGRMLHQGIVPDALATRGVHEKAYGFELVVAREDHVLDLHLASLIVAFLFHLQVYEARQQVEQAVPLQHLFPQVRSAVGAPFRIGRIAGASVAAFVERKKMCRRAGEPRGHEHGLGVHGEVDESAPLELEDGLARVSVLPVLFAGVLDSLPGEQVLQFQGGNWQSVDAQDNVEGLLRAR